MLETYRTGGDIQHARLLQFFKQNVCFGFQRRGAFADGVVKFTDAVFTGEFVGNHCGGKSLFKQRVCLRLGFGFVFRKGDSRHRHGVCL